MRQENTTMILFNFCATSEVQNADNAITFKISSVDKLRKVYTTTSSVSAGDTITSNYYNPSCSAVIATKLRCSSAR